MIEDFIPETSCSFHKNKFISAKNVKTYKQLHRQYRKWLKTKNSIHLVKYKQLKKNFKNNIIKDQALYKNKTINSKQTIALFRHVKSMLSAGNKEIILKNENGDLIRDKLSVCKLFNTFYLNVQIALFR